MTTSDIRQRLAAILDEEERALVNWTVVDQMLDALNRDLKEGVPDCPHLVWHFISDSDIRAKDVVYGDRQRREIKHFVKTGNFENGTKISPLGCVAVIAGIGALAFWLSQP